MVGIINSESRDDLKMARVGLYSSKLRDLGYSKSQISSVIEKLRSVAPTHYPYLLGAVLYSVLTKLYQQIGVSKLKRGLEGIIEEYKSSKLHDLLYDFLDVLNFIIDKNLRWEFYYSTITHGYFEYEYSFMKLGLKNLCGYQYNILLPSKALELFLKYLSKKYSDIEDPSKQAIIRIFEDHLREKIEKLEKYEKENLPKLLDESVKGVIEIYEKLGPTIENYLAYIEDIENSVIKSLDDLKERDKEIRSPHDYHFKLYMINKKLHYATEMRNYIEGILKMSYLIEINRVPIDKIMNLLNKTEDPLSNLRETYNLLSSEQWDLFDCKIMKKDWCTKR
ncbi:MAG: hypothetical protein RQ869_01025 [Candidatus Nanopusillus sp.]|nr:hypothetical protein [Candidatus Nanopusillus sp.]